MIENILGLSAIGLVLAETAVVQALELHMMEPSIEAVCDATSAGVVDNWGNVEVLTVKRSISKD